MPPAVAERAHVDVRPDDAFDDIIHASVWRRGAGYEDAADATEESGAVRCFALDPSADARRAYEALAPICGDELRPGMLEDLLKMDPLPGVGDVRGRVSKVAAFGANAIPSGDGSGSDGTVGSVSFELVEFLVADDWLILCCHEQPSVASPLQHDGPTSPRCRALLETAATRPNARALASAGDLGLLLLHELTRTYSETGRRLLRWMELWELDFFSERASDADATFDTSSLLTLRGLASEFGARVHAMDRSAHGDSANWFLPAEGEPSPVGSRLAAYAHTNVDRAVADADRLNTMLRSAFELVQTRRMADHLRLQRDQADRTDELQVRVERITSLFLVPSLIAAFFGANTALPGGNGDHAWESLAFMCVLMVVGAAGVWIVLGRIRRRSDSNRRVSAPVPPAPSDERTT